MVVEFTFLKRAVIVCARSYIFYVMNSCIAPKKLTEKK